MLCIGDSHMACVLVAAREAGVPIEPIVLKESKHFDEAGSAVEEVPPDRLAQWLERRGRNGPVFSFIGGRRHAQASFRSNPRPYDVVLPDDAGLPTVSDAEIVPVAALRASLARKMSRDLWMIDTVVKGAGGPVYHLEAPPPPSAEWWDGVRDKRRLVTSKELVQQTPYLAYKLWRLNSEIVRDRVARAGATFIQTPRSACDEKGLLRPELVSNATHANGAYGALVLEQMQAVL